MPGAPTTNGTSNISVFSSSNEGIAPVFRLQNFLREYTNSGYVYVSFTGMTTVFEQATRTLLTLCPGKKEDRQ